MSGRKHSSASEPVLMRRTWSTLLRGLAINESSSLFYLNHPEARAIQWVVSIPKHRKSSFDLDDAMNPWFDDCILESLMAERWASARQKVP